MAKNKIDKALRQRAEISKEALKSGGKDLGTKGLDSVSFGNGRTLTIDHVKCMNEMIKAIAMTPMDDYLKGLLITRLRNPTMGLWEIAARYGVRIHILLELEEEAKEKVKDYLRKTSLNEAIAKFNSSENSVKSTDLKNKINGNPFESAPEGECNE